MVPGRSLLLFRDGCGFERQATPSQETLHTLVLQVPEVRWYAFDADHSYSVLSAGAIVL